MDNPKWEGVPFYLESGKKMPKKLSEITIYFKPTIHCLCPDDDPSTKQNILRFKIQPDEGIEVCFWVKKPGFELEITEKSLSFEYTEHTDVDHFPEAYQEVLYDCIKGDQALFISSEESENAWKYITKILEGWGENPLVEY